MTDYRDRLPLTPPDVLADARQEKIHREMGETMTREEEIRQRNEKELRLWGEKGRVDYTHNPADLRDIRAAARVVVEAFGGAIPGVDPGAFYEAWWKRMNEAIGKLKEAVGEIK